MPVTVADSLRRARGRRFVGRVAERELFEQALRGETALSVLFVHGPGGVGKTALLGALADAARDAGVPATRLDLRAIEPSPAAFREALAAAAAAGAGAEPPAARDADGRRAVLLLDTYEAVGPLDAWLRERYLTELDAGTLVVIGGREPPAAAWHEDPGWRDLLRVVSLRNLRPEDARAYLRVADVPEALHDRVVDVTHGHPLALSLVVDVLDQRRASSGAPSSLALDEAPDLVRPLLARFMDAVPGTRQRAALEVCAHARFTTEDLLRGTLGGGDAGELFAWLRTLSFVEEGPHGIFPHDIARDALDADLRWRDPDAYADLHRRVRTRVLERVCGSAGREQQRFATDVVFLHRRNPFTAAYWDWKTLGEAYADALRPSDRDVLVAMARRHEGAASAELVAHWLDRQPQAFHVFRRGDGEAIGFAAVIALHEAAERDVAADPGTRAIWEFSQRHGPARPGEEVLARRFFMDARAYQAPSPSFNMLTVLHVQEVVSRPRLAWDLIAAFADDAVARMAPIMAYIDYERAPAADFEVGGRRHGVFAHDWRRVDADAWLELTGAREISAGFEPPAEEAAGAALLALSQPDFAAAVRRALRDLHRSDALVRNPLMRSRAVRERGGPSPSAQALVDLLEDAIAAVGADPRDEKLARALQRTFVRPARTQELAAEALGLPFSTYRRHLARGIEHVVRWLWERELYGPER